VPEHLLEGRLVVAPKLRDGLVVGPQPGHQPHKGQVVVALPFELAGTAYPVGVAVDQQLEHRARIVGGVADLVGVHLDAQLRQIQGLHEGIVGPYRVLGGHVVLDAGGQQPQLQTVAGSIGHERISFRGAL